MGGVVLPVYNPEFQGITQTVLFACGGISVACAVVNAIFGRRITLMMARMGLRSRVVIPREGLVYLGMMLLLAVGGLVGHSNMLLLVFGLMAGPWVINGWFVYTTLRRVTVKRQARDRVMVGESVVVDVCAGNSKSWFTSHMLDVRDEIASMTATGVSLLGVGIVTIARLPAGEKRTGHYRIVFGKRGLYQLGPIRISSRFPLGIGERGQSVSGTQTVLIRPRIGRLRLDWLRRQQEQLESRQSQPIRKGVFDDEFHHIRELRAGDSPRSIHWRSSARRGELMVQEFHQNRESELFVLLDLCEHPDFTDRDQELAVSAAATLCVSRTHGGSSGESMLAIAGHTAVCVQDNKPSRFANEALDALAICQPSKSPPLEIALQHLADAGVLHKSRGILITSRPEYCRLAVIQLCADMIPDAIDVMQRLTVVPAVESSLSEMVIFDDLSPLIQDSYGTDEAGVA